jgi:predicted NBD/HSP70 family sugar kinase
MHILVIDIGGNSVKLWHSEHEEHRKFPSGAALTPEEMVIRVRELVQDWTCDVVALGVPCRVSGGKPVDEPINLGPGWVGFNYAAALGWPVRVMNDAALQALGSYDGGRMLFLSLGTAVGSAFIAEGLILSLDLGRSRWDRDHLFELLADDRLAALNAKERRKRIKSIVPELKTMMLADYVVLGGGGANQLDELPDSCRRGHNRTVVEGGRRLWEQLPDPMERASDVWVVR